MADSDNQVDQSISRGYDSLSYKSSSLRKIKILRRGNFILRQELVSYTQECNPKCGIICNICIILIFLLAGIPLIFWTSSHLEFKQTYTHWYFLNFLNFSVVKIKKLFL